ncbi:MAG: putative ABC transport system permease protein [Myxococcota bacterium]
MIDRWTEIGETLGRNKLRTLLTALSVAWGIFMLVLLLGAGQGLENQIAWQFRDDATNSLWVYRGETSMAYQGFGVGRRVQFDDDDYEQLRQMVPGEAVTGRFRANIPGTVRFGDRVSDFEIRNVHPDHQVLERTQMVSGRFLNDADLNERRKVVVIGMEVSKFLFRGASALGAWIEVGGIPFQVVGVFEDVGGEGEMRMVYVPVTTARAAWGGADSLHQLMFTVGDASIEEAAVMEIRVRELLARNHDVHPKDRRAIRVRNNVESYQEVQQIFDFLGLFVWLVGLGTVLAGVVGVSNIMLVSVSERKSEIGLRKALGATPTSIVAMVLEEALLLTGVSGYTGLIAGLALIEGVARAIPENDYIRDPAVDLGTVIAATVLLVVAGVGAGFVPARRAAAVQPVTALRDG